MRSRRRCRSGRAVGREAPGASRSRVERVARRDPPPGQAHEVELPPLRRRERLHQPAAVHDEVEALRHRRSGQLDEDVADERQELDDVPVAVDNGVIDAASDLGHRRAGVYEEVIARGPGGSGAHRDDDLLEQRPRRREVAPHVLLAARAERRAVAQRDASVVEEEARAGRRSRASEQSSHARNVASGDGMTTSGSVAAGARRAADGSRRDSATSSRARHRRRGTRRSRPRSRSASGPATSKTRSSASARRRRDSTPRPARTSGPRG